MIHLAHRSGLHESLSVSENVTCAVFSQHMPVCEGAQIRLLRDTVYNREFR
jgi:hypothetical protein